MSNGSGKLPVAFLEKISASPNMISYTPPLLGISVNALIFSAWSCRMSSAKLAAFARYPHEVQYSIDSVRLSSISHPLSYAAAHTPRVARYASYSTSGAAYIPALPDLPVAPGSPILARVTGRGNSSNGVSKLI